MSNSTDIKKSAVGLIRKIILGLSIIAVIVCAVFLIKSYVIEPYNNRVNNNDVHSTGTHHSLCNLKCLISTVRLRDIQFFNVNTYMFSLYRIKRMFCIDKSCNTASFLYL